MACSIVGSRSCRCPHTLIAKARRNMIRVRGKHSSRARLERSRRLTTHRALVSMDRPPTRALPSSPRTNPLAITGLVLGIISITVGLCCYGLPFNIAGAIFSAIGLAQIKKDPQRERGEGVAVAGLVLSLLSLVFAVLLMAFYFSFGSSNLFHRLRRL